MKLFTKEIDKKLFAQYSMGSNLENQMVVAKIFNPYGRGVWYLLNSDPNDPDYLWAIVNLFEVEMGSVSRSELESILVPPFRLPLERDLYFTPVNAKVLYDGLLQGKHYAKGGSIENENAAMVSNNNKQIAHHTKELSSALSNSKHVPAWVVSKVYRAASDLSDATHYLEGEKDNYGKGGGVGTPLAQAKKKVAAMSDEEVAQEVETILAYEMMDYDETGEDLMNDMKSARKFLIEHYEEQFTDIDITPFSNGGGVGKAKSYLHLYKLTYPNGQYRVEAYDGEAMTPKEALEKMRISLRGLKSYKYSGASSDSENYKKWYEKKDIGYSDTEAWDEVFGSQKYANGGGVGYQHDVNIVTNREGENYLFPSDKEDNSMGVLLKRGGGVNNEKIIGKVKAKNTIQLLKEGADNNTKKVKVTFYPAYNEAEHKNLSDKTKKMLKTSKIEYFNIVEEDLTFALSDNPDIKSVEWVTDIKYGTGGRASEVLKETDYISNRKIDAVIIDGKRYDGKSIVDGVYLRKTASGSADMPQQSAAPVVEPSKPKPAKPTRKPKPMSDGGELLNPQFAETDAQMFERRFGVSVKQIADELKGYDKNSVLRGDAERTYESISGKEVSDIERGAFYKFLLAGFSFYDIKLGKSKAIVLPTFDEQDLDNGLRIHVKPQYAKPLSKEGFLSMKNILGTDELRPIMMCVYFDDGNLIGTDAHKLVVIKQTQSESELKPIFKDLIKKEVNKYAGGKEADTIIENNLQKIFDGGLDKKPINFTTGMYEDGTKFPDYKAVIPKNIEYTESVSIQSLIDACNGVYELKNNCYDKFGILKINFQSSQNEGQDIGFNAEFLLDTLQVLQVNGAKSVKLSPSTPTRACGIFADNGNYALIMPLYSSNNFEMPCNYSIPMATTESNFIPRESVIAKFKYKAGGKITEAQREKIETVMDEFGQGKLNIGLSDKKVTNRKQAVAIALSEAGVSNKSKRGWKHKK